MPMLPELVEAFAASPLFTQPLPPPPGVPLHQYAREQANAVLQPWVEHFRERAPSDTEYTVLDKAVPVDGGDITVRFLTPAGGAPGAAYGAAYPVLVWFHGGGWMIGDLDMDDSWLRTVCVELQLAIANVEYRCAPECPFPVPFEDSYIAVKWVAENAATLNVSLSKGFLLGGDSAGANLSAAIALKARDDPFFAGRPLTGQYLREPAVMYPLAWPEELKLSPRSFEVNTDVPLLNSERALNSFDTYGGPPTDLRVSPLLAPSHAGLPPAYFQVMAMDPLHDDGVVFERLLREAGVSTQLVEYSGFLHGAHYTFPTLQTSVKVDQDARKGLKWLLSLSA